ncbi:hypothetical protein ONS96_013170 [Cadophora gregata f. sp. sojae]|nr:hypothetical protein ONS96_013170 [Cadophora gregata f. sp. sojae]
MADGLQVSNPVFPPGFRNLVSVVVELDMEYSTLQEFLVTSPNVRILSLKIVDRDFRFDSTKGRLPPFKELKLYSYPWRHTSAETALLWDFSKLECLLFHAKRHSYENFLTAGATQQFPHLRKLDCLSEMTYPISRRHEEESSAEHELGMFISKLRRLEDLTTSRYCPGTLVSYISRVGAGLKKLRLKVGQESTNRFLRTADLLRLQQNCPDLEVLEIHCDPAEAGPKMADLEPLLDVLCGFEKVAYLEVECVSHWKIPTADEKDLYRHMMEHKRGTSLLNFEYTEVIRQRQLVPGTNSWRHFEEW